MNHLHLVLPGLFPPQEITAELCSDLGLHALEKLLARATRQNRTAAGLEDWLCRSFAAAGVAPVRAAADGLDVSRGYWLCADPVNLHLLRAEALLLPETALGQEEAQSLCAELQTHFADEGLHFHAPHPLRWYLQLDAVPDLRTVPLSQALGRDVKVLQPLGADALYWQRLLNEVQMLLYAQPLNRAREERGEFLLNSLWLWGGGHAVGLARPYAVAGGDEPLAAQFARVAGVEVAASFEEILDHPAGRGLWLYAAPRDAWQRQDGAGWRIAMLELEQTIARPLLQALQRGALRTLTLELLQAERSLCFTLTAGASWKLWRRPRALVAYAE